MVHLILVLLALVFFAVSVFGIGGRFNLVAGGLFCWLLAQSGLVG